MDKEKDTDKKHSRPSTSTHNPNENIENINRYDRLFNIFRESDQLVASQNVIDETNRLYLYHLTDQMAGAGLRFPFEDRQYLVIPHNASSLQILVNRFALSPQRRWVHEQAQNVDLDSLNFITFQQLMYGLFQEGGVTWERVLVLFYFCTDLSIRALQEKFVDYFIRIYNWTTSYITRRLSVWVEQEGGWGVVLQTSVDYARNFSILGVCAIGVLLMCLYIRSRS
ncbi:bcl-2-like protein 1 [Anoplophora glabripennis]|uniref:bcl-2-like protein 1 n=1 Tax=Anoplophora glabripennis TaxID=217634 RepID=UPI000C77B05E|nr:bcl-2-like protein 1 [Anoplophora glabripennis]